MFLNKKDDDKNLANPFTMRLHCFSISYYKLYFFNEFKLRLTVRSLLERIVELPANIKYGFQAQIQVLQLYSMPTAVRQPTSSR